MSVSQFQDKSSKKFEMVNIIDDDIWNAEPALRPEDEIILRKLHEMLQSTADDLKMLSGELAKFHEPGVVYKTALTPLDEEFNERVHIEEVVNAKFHGHKIINRPKNITVGNFKNDADFNSKNNISKPKPLNTNVKDSAPVVTKRLSVNRNLGVSRVKIMEINNKNEDNTKTEKLNNGKVLNVAPAVGYNEFNFTYVEPKVSPRKVLQVQDMPSINIRSELKRQNVLQLDILPGSKDKVDENSVRSNVSVIALRHETESKKTPTKENTQIQPKGTVKGNSSNTIRKVSKMSTCESSGSTNNISSDSKVKLVMQKRLITSIRNSPKNSARSRTKKNTLTKNELEQRHRANLEEWKRKLNAVYGSSTSKKPIKTAKSKFSPKKSVPLNNVEYIPYSKLTVGGVRASDIEKEISDLPNKNEVPLSPILDKILSRENSFHQDSPRHLKDTPRILTTSDENLLQEVIDIEKSVADTLSRNKKQKHKPKEPEAEIENISSDDVNYNSEGNESYVDDFEDEKTDHSGKSSNKPSAGNESEAEKSREADSDSPIEIEKEPVNSKDKNVTYTKTSTLSFKDSVDIFEFIHSVDTQDNATQSDVSGKISPKETQTSPQNDKSSNSIQPIHNDLWPSIDPKREVEKMFELEKDFIKKLIMDEYGDLLEKNINKPSTSNESTHGDTRKNIAALQKNTQTSPAHVKSVMTSPKRTKTRTTSPFHLTVPVNKDTSPMIFVTNEENHNVDIKSDADDISVNLSSPRFSLRLPQTSREVLSNITIHSRNSPSPSKINLKVKKSNKTFRTTTISSSSSVDADNSSSELSSLGEIKIKRRLKKKIPSLSECSSSSTLSKYSHDMQSVGILPLRSEGEVSLTQGIRKRGKSRQSEGETSFGQK